ncbi:MAG: hypothetical protein PHQ75_03845, partial [Thermoguttaceae bacterium]|nr:hypothetical protein [Thermoguttaceae bacterium]
VTAVLSVVNVVWLLVFIAVLAFVLYDVIVPGPFMGREFLRVLAPFGTLGELSGFLASKRTARRDEKGNPWTTESVTAVVLEVVENESGIKRDKIDLDMHLSELD